MSDERPATSDESDATEHDNADDGRIERLRELLTAPIKIPESESGDRAGETPTDPEDYPAPSVDIPPHVRAAAEAAAHAGDDEPRRTRTGKKRRTWADAFLDTGKRDLSAAGDDAAAQLLTRLDELDRRTGEDIGHARARAEAAAEAAEAARQGLEETRTATREAQEAVTARVDGVEQRVAAAGRSAEATDEKVAGLRETADAQREEIARLAASLAETQSSAVAAREQAAATARKAATATVVAAVAVVLAVAALAAAFAL
ncbi:hypothetical protein [Myceligenerans salitolerans]|uniref:Apolipoprotein A1/A4/E domain protein n=1 Tax=Myceligenerans salitolerans TaxID=1230528 RepID=A0ABS3ICV3_9MICO|nr:hypothetical protein [Myceligenerans salitolerans]MBO0610258.1 hypothetical protein [Myceligenerans salitolerans]